MITRALWLCFYLQRDDISSFDENARGKDNFHELSVSFFTNFWQLMEAEVRDIYDSKLFSVHNFLCRCTACSVSAREYSDRLSIVYIRKGNFQFKVFRNDLDVYHGLFLINKPGHEFRVGHVHELPDECTIFAVPQERLPLIEEQGAAYTWFFSNPDLKSILIPATPGTEYLHHEIFRLLHTPRVPRLLVDSLIGELLGRVLVTPGGRSMRKEITEKQKRHYLPGIEATKEFIHAHFTEDLGLVQLAQISNLSPFHFTRLFSKMTSTTPYQYMLRVRLEQARLQLLNTSMSVTEVAFSSGFNSLEHFSAAYKKMYGCSPAAARR